MLMLILSLLVLELLFIKLSKLIYLIPFINLALFGTSFYYSVLNYPNIFIIFLVYFLFFKIFSSFRVYVKGKNMQYLKQVTFRSALILDLFILLDASFIYVTRNLNGFNLFIILMITGFVFTSYIAIKTYRSKLLISKFNNDKNLDYKNLPTISVLVPARNETNDLLRCLDSIARSDYPKMEVIVLDDCSTELKTPQIIRDFAQQGMKFIAGSEPEKEWTAKNWAYQQLVEASSGEYLIFLGVDVIVKPDSFTKLISTISSQKKKMISLIPINVYKNFDIGYYLNQPMRYLIELILPNSIIKSAPAISTLWAIDRKAFNKLGGMKSVDRTVMPEKYFARELSKENSYLFAASDKTLGIYSDKSRADQKDTSIRLTYPTLRKRPEVVSIFILLFSLSAIMPFISLLVGIINSNFYILVFGLINFFVITLSVAMVNYLAYRKIGLADYLIAPVSLLYAVGVAFRSMYDYEYSEVYWKKRNVCIPVMRQY